MTKNKKNWQVKKLKEICNFQNGFAFKSSDYVDTGFFVMRIGNVQDGYVTLSDPKYIQKNHKLFDKFVLQSGDILISLTGNVGRVGVINNEHLPAVMNQRVARIAQSDANFIRKEFLLYFLKSSYFIEELIKVGHGAAQQNISTKDIESLEISFPASSEQLHIVKILDEVFEKIARAKENAEKNLRNAKELFESYLQDTFSNPKSDWKNMKLGDIFNIKHGFAFQGEFFSKNGDYVLLTPGNFYEDGGYRDRGNKQKYYIGEIPKNYILNKGDLLVAMTEQAAGLLGSSIIIPESNKFLHNQRLGLIVNSGKYEIDTMFLFHLFNTKRIRSLIHKSASGVKVRHTSPGKISIITISLPPLSEQKAIVAKLDALSAETKKLEAIYKQKLVALEELKKSVLKRAFSGEL